MVLNCKVTGFFLIFRLGCDAQPYLDIANAQFYKTGHGEIFAAKDTQADVRYSSIALSIPIVLKNNDVLLVSPAYRNTFFPDHLNNAHGFTDILFPMTYVMQWKDTSWKTSFTFIPRIASDFENNRYSEIHLQFGGAVVMNYQRNPKIKYRFGVYYNREFFGNYFLPLAGIDWRVNKKLNIFGLLPNDLSLEYKALKFLHAGFSIKSTFHSYVASYDGFKYKSLSYLRISEAQTLIYADVYVTQNLVLNISAGGLIVREYALGETGGDETEFSLDDELIFGAGLAYRIRLGK